MILQKEFIIPVVGKNLTEAINTLRQMKDDFLWDQGLTEKNVVTSQITADMKIEKPLCKLILYYKDMER